METSAPAAPKMGPAPEPGAPPKAPPFSPAAGCAQKSTSPILESWPRSAQWSAAVLLAGVVVLLACNAIAGFRAGTRATDHLDRGGAIYRLELNRARHAELVQLPGVGHQLAARIIDFRKTNGPFRSVAELRKVPGIGPKSWERLRNWVCVDFESAIASIVSTPALAQAPQRHSKSVAAAPSKPGKNNKEANLAGTSIDVNQASVIELQRLPRVGPTLSQRIVAERARGLFRSVNDLRRVKGISPKTLEKLRPYITTESNSSTLAEAKKLK